MKAATIHELKQELNTLQQKELVELCQRLGKFKKENKELLTYLLYEANDEEGYIKGIKKEIDEQFSEINLSHLYYAKKSLRKIVRMINKYCRYSGIRTTELELHLYFCETLKESGIPIRQNKVISNMYDSEVKKIKTALATLHEDLQYDYLKQVEKL
jgi:HPt (histidine-containing phosphotransfer) domain-containing protein